MQLKIFGKHFSNFRAKKRGEEGKFPQHLRLLRDNIFETFRDKGYLF